MGYICPACVEYLSQRNPERFHSSGEYAEALRRYPEPIWATTEEAHRVERELGQMSSWK
ncbi:MAG: hypothetical protein JOZ19_09145 [Rubrobacter sp.]|nr:hypothetical protein [Rubrobacter sp.]